MARVSIRKYSLSLKHLEFDRCIVNVIFNHLNVAKRFFFDRQSKLLECVILFLSGGTNSEPSSRTHGYPSLSRITKT